MQKYHEYDHCKLDANRSPPKRMLHKLVLESDESYSSGPSRPTMPSSGTTASSDEQNMLVALSE